MMGFHCSQFFYKPILTAKAVSRRGEEDAEKSKMNHEGTKDTKKIYVSRQIPNFVLFVPSWLNSSASSA